MLGGGPLGLVGVRLGLEGGPPGQGAGGPLGQEGGRQALVGAAGGAQEALRVQALQVAWGVGAGLQVGVGAETLGVGGEGADHSSVGAGAASLREAQRGGWAGPAASPS